MADYGLPNVCNCCAPACPTVIVDVQTKQASLDQCGIKNTAISNELWNGSLYGRTVQTITETYEEDYYNDFVSPQANPSTWTVTNTKAFDANGSCITTTVQDGFDQTFYVFPTALPTTVVTNTSITESYTNATTGSRSDITIFSEQATNQGLKDAADTVIANNEWSAQITPPYEASFGVAYSENAAGPTPYYSSLGKKIVRYRLRIPEGTNTYMKYVVEEVFTPADYDSENPEVSPKVITEKTITWAGPGVGGDDDSWATGWQELETNTAGTKTWELIKHQCYTGGAWVLA
jgi:hypothetical protein